MKLSLSVLVCVLAFGGALQAKDVDIMKKNSKGNSLFSSLDKAHSLFVNLDGMENEMLSKKKSRHRSHRAKGRVETKGKPSYGPKKNNKKRKKRSGKKRSANQTSNKPQPQSNPVSSAAQNNQATAPSGESSSSTSVPQVTSSLVKSQPISEFIFVDTKTASRIAQDGTINRPYATIQSAINSVRAEDSRTIAICSGTYDEDLEIGPQKRISLVAIGDVNLGAFSTESGEVEVKGTPRNISWKVAQEGMDFLALKATSLDSAFRISGNIVVSSSDTAKTVLSSSDELSLQAELFGAISVHPDVALDVVAKDSVIHGAITGQSTTLKKAISSRFCSELDLLSYQLIQNCEIQNGFRVQRGPYMNTLALYGIYNTNLTGTFEGPEESLVLDPVTNYWFVQSGNEKEGEATKVIIHDASTL